MDSSDSRPFPSEVERGLLPGLRLPGLRLYGSRLLSGGAAFWIVCATVLIVIMATAEAFAWGYVAAFMAQGGLRWLVAGVVGAFVFAIIWILDATFMTLDLKRAEYEETLFGRKVDTSGLRHWRFWGGVLGRLLLVTGSLYLSAPFLAQLIFQDDIEARIAAIDDQRVAARRLALEESFDVRGAELMQERRQLGQASVAEAAGRGPSGRRGRGPAVATLERQMAELDARIDALAEERSQALAGFDALTPEEVADRYGVELAGRGLQARGEILEQLLAEDAYDNAEIAVRAFLFFLFMGLLILKLFQPRSVEVYYSEQLQSLYRQYRAGAFDALLPEVERSSGAAPMDAMRFEDWCLNDYATVRREDRERREKARELQLLEERVEQLHRVAEATEAELAPDLEDHRARRERVRELDERLDRVRGALSQTERESQEQRSTLVAMDDNLGSSRLDDEAFAAAMSVRARLVARVTELQREVEELTTERDGLERQRDHETAALGALDRELTRRRSLLRGVEESVRRSRERYVTALLHGELEGSTGNAPEEPESVRSRLLDDESLPQAWQARLLRGESEDLRG